MNLKDFITKTLADLPEGTEVEFDLCVIPGGLAGVIVSDRYPDAAPVSNRIRFKLTVCSRAKERA